MVGAFPGHTVCHMSSGGDIRLLRFSGELDMVTARGMAGDLSQAVGDTTSTPVADLRTVTFIDSMALAALAHAGEQLRNQGRALTLVVRDGGPVADLLEGSGLADRFELVSELPGSAPGSTPDPAAAGETNDR